MCLSNQVRPGREWFPSPLGDFNRLFEGLIGELFKIWLWNMFYLFWITSIWPLKCEFLSLLCWLKQAEYSIHFTIKKANKTSFHGASCQLAPFNSHSDNLNTQSTVLTDGSAMVASVVHGEWGWQSNQNVLNSVLSPICLLVSLNAEVMVVVVVVGCVHGSWSQISTFSCYSHCLPLIQNASKGYENNLQEPVL